MFFKKKYQVFIKIIVVFLLIISVFQPWWYLSGSNNDLSTETKTMLYPPKIISFTDSTEGLGGSVNIIPEELSSVLFLLSLMVFVLIIIILFEIFTNDRFRKINFSLKSFEIIIPIAVVFIFYYAMSLVTKLGVGSFIGSDLISVTVPGQVQNLSVYCSWGPGIGFYLVILSIIILFFSIFYKKTCIYRKFLNK